MAARRATPKGSANSEIRCLFVQNKSADRTGISVGDSVLFYKLMATKSMRRRRGLAVVLVLRQTTKFQVQTSRVAKCCVRERMGPKDLGEGDWNPASERLNEPEVLPSSTSGESVGVDTTEWARRNGRRCNGRRPLRILSPALRSGSSLSLVVGSTSSNGLVFRKVLRRTTRI